MKIYKIYLLATLTLLIFWGNTFAATIAVPLEYPSIQTAIDAAFAGDEIFIADGTYQENTYITLKSNVSLRGESKEGTILMNPGQLLYAKDVTGASISNMTFMNDKPDWTTVGSFWNSPVNIHNVIVQGFRSGLFYGGYAANIGNEPKLNPSITDSLFINNGTGLSMSGGFYGTISGNTFQENSGSAVSLGTYSSPIIAENTIIDNGQALSASQYCNPTIQGNLISGNYRGLSFGHKSHATILNNVIDSNTLDGIGTYTLSRSTIRNNLISNNGNNGILVHFDYPYIINNTIVNNGANGIRVQWYAGAYLYNNIIAYNGSWGVNDSADYAENHPAYRSSADLYYTNVFGNIAGETAPYAYLRGGNISLDPMFRNPAEGNYQLSLSSPCIDAGNPISGYNDLDGSRNDMGAFGGPYALVGEDLTPEEITEEIQSQIIVLPEVSFKNEADGRKEEFELKLEEVINLIQLGDVETDLVIQSDFYKTALDKLNNDILKKADGHFGGNPSNDWIVTYEAQSTIYPTIVDLTNLLNSLLIK